MSRATTGAFAVSALATLLLVPAAILLLRPFDALVAEWAEHQYAAIGIGVVAIADVALRLGLVALVIAAALATAHPTRTAIAALVVIALANVAAEVLKTAIERGRPTDIALAGGNSLPSGHVLGCTVTALVAIGVMRHTRWRPWSRALLASAAITVVLLEATARLVRGSHWLSDVAASMLLGLAWVLAARAVAPAGWRAAVLTLITLASIYALFYLFPGLRLHLPSP